MPRPTDILIPARQRARSTLALPLLAHAALASLLACTPNAAQRTPTQPEPPPAAAPARYTVADFYENIEYVGASWAPSGDKILVSSKQSGIWNAYAVPLAGGAPQPLTRSTQDSIMALSYFPADERILYSSDQGGNGLTHIFVRDPDGATKDLTPGKELKALFSGWAGDDKSFFLQTNERDPRFFDVYEVTTDGYQRSLVYKNDEGYLPGPISRDKRYIALVKPRTTSDADIYLHDRQTKTTRHITPHTGSVNHAPQDFSRDGTKLLFTSDAGREFTSLRACDLATGQASVVYELEWDILGAAYTKNDKYLVVYVNEDSRYDARLLDAKTMKPVALPGMPPGIIRGIDVSRDESRIAFYSSDGSAPEDLWGGSIAGALKRLTSALNPRIRREDLVAPSLVRFKSHDGVEIPGLLYKPRQASPAAKAPAVVVVHGGPGGQAQVGYFAPTQALVTGGYVVFEINHRGSSGYGKSFLGMDDRKHGEADLGDVVASKRMLIDTGYVDPAKIGIVGASLGGYLTLAALTLRPDEFEVGVDLFGISNWVRTLESMPPWWAPFREALYAEVGDPKVDGERLRRMSPIFNADKIKAPLMVLQGANDPAVLEVESSEIVAAARKNGVPVEYVLFPDEGHGFQKKENEIKGYTRMIQFLDTHLKGTAPPAPPVR